VNETLLLIFVACTAIAIVIQAFILFALYQAAKRGAERMESVERIAGRLEQQATPVLATAQAILDDAQPRIGQITSNLTETTVTIRNSAAQIAQATNEIVEKARAQAGHIEQLINETASKVEHTTDYIQNTVVAPVRRVHAVVQALNAGLGFLKRSHAEKKAGAAAGKGGDEGMFI
jgi:methyl-accepting chemotaxis protein